jgi:hypothetical protein
MLRGKIKDNQESFYKERMKNGLNNDLEGGISVMTRTIREKVRHYKEVIIEMNFNFKKFMILIGESSENIASDLLVKLEQ